MSDNLKKDILSVAYTNNRTANNQSTNKNSNLISQILKPPQNARFTLKDPKVLFESGDQKTNN